MSRKNTVSISSDTFPGTGGVLGLTNEGCAHRKQIGIQLQAAHQGPIHGKKDVNAAQTLVMPALGTDPNVMCYIDDIYTYLRARADGKLGRGRPAKHEAKTQEAIDAENACMGPS